MPVKRVDVGVTKSVAEGKRYLKIDEINKMNQRRQHWSQHTHVITLTLTSPALGGPTVMVSATKGCFGPRATMALHVMGLPSVDAIVDLDLEK